MIRKSFFSSPEFDSTRRGFGKGLLRLGSLFNDVWVLTADLGGSTCVNNFKDSFPDRFVQVGVAEQNLVCVASGIASMNKVVFASSFAMFSPGRNWEQIRTTIAYNDQPVIVVGSHTGLGVGEDGATHQALEDVALMRVIPNMVVVVPCDALQAEKAVFSLYKRRGPSYLRLNRQKSPLITTASSSFKLGSAQVLVDGKDLVIFGCGPILVEAIKASVILKNKGFSVAVVNIHTIKPLDEESVVKFANKCGCFLVVEDHQISGGLGSAISEVLIRSKPVKGDFVGINDEFGESGDFNDLFWKHGLNSERIVTKALKLLRNKKNVKRVVKKSFSKKKVVKKSAKRFVKHK
ncbi:transketolase family protein [Candidatus Woesearchaeota archaeon]|nr:transketolase family protein [Candidatus Woesearchaeota archaeon]